jgi:Glucose-6-phosphate dehydrogenase, NAD binding domain
MSQVEGPFTVVVFGATGDLTARNLVPALFRLWKGGAPPAACWPRPWSSWAGGYAQAQEKKEHTLDGHIVKIDDDKLTMVGEDKKEVTHPVPKEAKITFDGKDAKLKDLKPHTKVKVTMKEQGDKHTITKVEAKTKK